MKILSIKIKKLIDDNPDTSYLGKYSDKRTSEFSIDRAHDLDCAIQLDEDVECDCVRGKYNWNCREYRYFNPSFNYVDEKGNRRPELTALKVRQYVHQDYDRREDYNRGGWYYLGITAVARVKLSDSDLVQTITSGGLWGIESDSDDKYIDEIIDEQLKELESELLAIGFTKEQIAAIEYDEDQSDVLLEDLHEEED